MMEGPPLWYKCECGKWLDNKTGEHIELEVLTLKELLERYGQECPEKRRGNYNGCQREN